MKYYLGFDLNYFILISPHACLIETNMSFSAYSIYSNNEPYSTVNRDSTVQKNAVCTTGPHLNIKTGFSSMGIPSTKIRQPWDASASETSAGCLRSTVPTLGMRELFRNVTKSRDVTINLPHLMITSCIGSNAVLSTHRHMTMTMVPKHPGSTPVQLRLIYLYIDAIEVFWWRILLCTTNKRHGLAMITCKTPV